MKLISQYDSSDNNKKLLLTIGIPKPVVQEMTNEEIVLELKALGYDWVKKSFGNFSQQNPKRAYEYH